MLEELIEGLSTPCQVLRKYSTRNQTIDDVIDKIPNRPGFFRLDGEPYWVSLDGERKLLYYIYVLGKPPYHSMPSERFPTYARTLREGASAILGISRVSEADKLVVPEAMGFHVGGILSAMTGKQFVPIAREVGKSRRYADDVSSQEIKIIPIGKTTGYGTAEMFACGLERGDRVVLVDTIVSTGGTAVGIINALREHGIDLLDFASYVAKTDYKGEQRIAEQTGLQPKCLLNLSINDVYDQEGVAYADTRLEKSKWWERGENAYKKLKNTWDLLEAQTYNLRL